MAGSISLANVADRLAHLARDELGEPWRLLAQQAGELVEDRGALLAGSRRPAGVVERPSCRIDRRGQVVEIGLDCGRHEIAGRGIGFRTTRRPRRPSAHRCSCGPRARRHPSRSIESSDRFDHHLDRRDRLVFLDRQRRTDLHDVLVAAGRHDAALERPPADRGARLWVGLAGCTIARELDADEQPRPRTSPTRGSRRPRRPIDRGVTRQAAPTAPTADRGASPRSRPGPPPGSRRSRGTSMCACPATSAASPRTARGPRTTQGRHRSPCPRSSGPARRRCAPRPTAGRSGRSRTGSRRTQAGFHVSQSAQSPAGTRPAGRRSRRCPGRARSRSRPTVRSPTRILDRGPHQRERTLAGQRRTAELTRPPIRVGVGQECASASRPTLVRNAALPFTPTTPPERPK